MITEQMIADGYDKKLVRLMNSPNDDGTVCRIGDYWFYFGGQRAECMSAEEYRTNTHRNDIIREIFETLDDFKKDDTSAT